MLWIIGTIQVAETDDWLSKPNVMTNDGQQFKMMF